MNIKSLVYKDDSVGWELELMAFNNLTLLVGATGVGKTRILLSILNVKRIARGISKNGITWDIEFSTIKGLDYKWSGVFENKGFIPRYFLRPVNDSGDDERDLPIIKEEKLFIKGELVIDRDKDGIKLNGKKTVKLSQTKSAISLLKEEDQIKDVYDEFEQVVFDDNTFEYMPRPSIFDEESEAKQEKYKDLESIRASGEDVKSKLYLTYVNQRPAFLEIANAFMDIFPHIEDVKIEPLSQKINKIPAFLKEEPFIQIKEKDVEDWIDEASLSSGMLRTLMHIAELHLCADGTVILIDEFENSLGINCIDELTSSIVRAGRHLQFIITSHHPYIINNIDYSNWKLITRNAGKVKARDVKGLGIGKSKHDAFTQLMNLDQYAEGVEV
ncbi:MAG: AAA family ATPase [Candidatus Anammoxibacter sp.]